MGTTSGGLAKEVLSVMVHAGVRFGLLHDPDYLDSGNLSDVDTVVADHPSVVFARCLSGWLTSGLHPVLVWRYDVGGTSTVFLMESDASSGVQLDLLHDPAGIGKYGVRSDWLLDYVEYRDFPYVSEAARLVYLFQKRRVKGQASLTEEVVARAASVPGPVLEKAALEITRGVELPEATRGAPHEVIPAVRGWRQLQRLATRLIMPIGHWAHVTEERVAKGLGERFGAVLPVVQIGPGPSLLGEPVWYLRRVAPVRYRPGLFISWGVSDPILAKRGQMVVDAREVDDAARVIVDCMERRALRCVF